MGDSGDLANLNEKKDYQLNKTVVGDSSPKHLGLKKQFNHKKYAILTILIVGLLLVAGIVIYDHNTPRNNQTAKACTDANNSALFNQAVKTIMGASSLSTQKSIITKIKNLSGYNEDPNCLYIVTQYYINIGDLSSAQVYDKEFQKTYNPATGLNNDLVKTGVTAGLLNQRLSNLEKHINDITEDTRLS